MGGRVANVNLEPTQEATLSAQSGSVKERVERKLTQFDQIESPQEAQTQVAVLPLTAVHEARYALQQLKEQYGSDESSFEILEPISRIIGWVEATTYFMDVSTQRQAMQTVLQSQQLQPQTQQSRSNN